MGKYTPLKGSLTRFVDEDPAYVAKIDAKKREILTIPHPNEVLCRMLRDAKAEKDQVAEQEKAINLRIAALENILASKFEDQDITSLKTGDGTFSLDDEPVVQFPDRSAFYSWIRETGQEDLFTVNARTAGSLVKEKLLAGEALPPGTAVYMRVGIRTLKPKGEKAE